MLVLLACAPENAISVKDPTAEAADTADTASPADTACAPGTWYADRDGDGHGDRAKPTESCDQPDGTVEEGDDCDDTDPAVWRPEDEIWYDGIDEACDDGDDYDQDGDGDRPPEWGGTDCDDTDASVTGPCPVDCTHLPAADLAALAPIGASDLTYDRECRAYVGTIVNGQDQVQVFDGAGLLAAYTGDADYDMGAVGITPAGAVLAGWSEGILGLGIATSPGPLATIYSQPMQRNSGTWSHVYLQSAPTSIAADTDCAWIPEVPEAGSVSCVAYADGSLADTVVLGDWVESVALASDGSLWAAAGADLYQNATLMVTFSATILDIAVHDGVVYAELDDRRIVAFDGSSVTDFRTGLSGQAKIAISPEGWLVRMVPVVLGTASFEEWPL